SVLGTVRTAISDPVFAFSAVMVCVRRCRLSGGITPAKSVTKPCGCGMGGSTANAVAASSSAGRRTRARPGLRMERVEPLHDPLHLAEILAEFEPERARNEPRAPFTVVEEAGHQRQRPEDLLSLHEDVAVARSGFIATQA